MLNDDAEKALHIAKTMKANDPGNKHKGAIHSSVAGRTDHLPMHVESGSYVIPADIISAMGEGNSMAGFKVARSIFGNNDDDQRSSGGKVKSGVPIIAAGGEYVVTPAEIERLGDGDIERGHKILDHFILKYRKKTIETLSKLPGPK